LEESLKRKLSTYLQKISLVLDEKPK